MDRVPRFGRRVTGEGGREVREVEEEMRIGVVVGEVRREEWEGRKQEKIHNIITKAIEITW